MKEQLSSIIFNGMNLDFRNVIFHRITFLNLEFIIIFSQVLYENRKELKMKFFICNHQESYLFLDTEKNH